jgi:hypothetical protein
MTAVPTANDRVALGLPLLPLVVLPAVALSLRSMLTGWGFMWAMAWAIYAGCKWLTYCEARASGAAITRARTLGYLLAWPGMDATAFLLENDGVARPSSSEWIAAAFKTILGVVLIWATVRLPLPDHPLLGGWLGMLGVVFVLHFGVFHLLSLGWRTIGVNAMPVMRNPLRSTSLAEFWGRRWNTAFHELAARFTFRPLRPILGVTGASLIVFVLSGVIHELVISLPASGGYGLPTGYFILQGLGVAGERTVQGRRIGLGRGWRGRMFAFAVAAGPVVLLFPPPFVRNVILPMLAIMRAS